MNLEHVDQQRVLQQEENKENIEKLMKKKFVKYQNP